MERLTCRVDGDTQLDKMGRSEICMYRCQNSNGCESCPIQEAFEKLAMYEDLDEKGRVISEATQEQYDKIMKINWYLTERYADEVWKEFGVERTGDVMKDLCSVMDMTNKIYEVQKEKYPLMWYEYALCSNKTDSTAKAIGDDFKQNLMDRFTKVE